MKILFLTKDLFYNGGGERMLVNLANELSLEHKVDILTLITKKNDLLFELNKNVDILTANIDETTNKLFVKYKLWMYVKTNRCIFDNYDVVIGVGIISNLLLAMVSSKLETKCIGWEHTSYRGAPLRQRILRKMTFGKLNNVVVLTKYDLEKYKRINKNSRCIYNFTTMESCVEHSIKKRFLYVGRLEKEKGIEHLRKIILSFSQFSTDWKICVIGDGTKRVSFLRFIKKHGLEKLVEYKEKSRKVQEEIEKSDAVILCSNVEGLPMVLIEARKCKVPAISFDTITGPREIIQDKVNGFLVPCFDINEFVDRMRRIVENPYIFKEWQNGDQGELDEFDKNHIVEEWRMLLQTVD